MYAYGTADAPADTAKDTLTPGHTREVSVPFATVSAIVVWRKDGEDNI
jgi:hypothetical protein